MFLQAFTANYLKCLRMGLSPLSPSTTSLVYPDIIFSDLQPGLNTYSGLRGCCIPTDINFVSKSTNLTLQSAFFFNLLYSRNPRRGTRLRRRTGKLFHFLHLYISFETITEIVFFNYHGNHDHFCWQNVGPTSPLRKHFQERPYLQLMMR